MDQNPKDPERQPTICFGYTFLEWHMKHRYHDRENKEIRDMAYLYKLGFRVPDRKIITVAKIIHCHDCNEIFVYDYLNDEVKL